MSEKPTYEELKQRIQKLEQAEFERERISVALEKRIVALTLPLDDTGVIAFDDLFNLDDIQRLQDEFATATGVASIITHPDGTPITRPSNFCRLCNDIIRKTKKGRANCYKSDAVIGRLSQDGPIVQPCMSGGLWDAGAGVSVGGRHIANWLIGQVRDATQTEDKIRAYSREIGTDESTMVVAFREVPSMSRERFEQIAQVLFTLANQLSTTAYQNVQQARFITERNVAEEDLKITQLAVETAAINIFWLNSSGRFVYVNERAAQSLLYTLDEILSMHVWDIDSMLPKEQWPKFWESFKNEKTIHFEMIHQRKDGSSFPVDIHAVYIGVGGKEIAFAFAQDITKRKLAEQSLRESEERYSLLTQNSQTGIYIHVNGVLKFVNNHFAEMLGYKPEKMIGRIYWNFVHPGDREMVKGISLARARGEAAPNEYEFRHQNKDGETIWVHNLPTIIKYHGQVANMGNLIQINDRKQAETEKDKLQSQLRQSQKMESIGTLAGGIAHDFNNILGIILGNAELAMDDVAEWNPARQNLDEVRKACMRAKDVVRQILSFSRKSEVEQKSISIASVVAESLKLSRASIPTSIEIRQNIADDVDDILGDPTQIHQVMINFCANAAHAMENDGGILDVTLENTEVDEDTASQYPELNPGPHVHLCVRDTGDGIKPEIVDRVFDPYFTTKDVGKGTGMGLAVVHGIVKSHHGSISVESELGKGTTFKILFPAVKEKIGDEPKEAQELPTGKEKILFVDDEESMVNLNQQRLEKLGYKVIPKTDPLEALEFFSTNPDQIDLIISDMTMPHMAGDKLAQEILNIRPDMPIIICTGYSERMSEDRAQEIGIRKYIEKPIEMANLARSVREVLDGQ
jgi:two-component system, cell cycle sensor histidine kinase and response regulator CckA